MSTVDPGSVFAAHVCTAYSIQYTVLRQLILYVHSTENAIAFIDLPITDYLVPTADCRLSSLISTMEAMQRAGALKFIFNL